MPSPLKLVEWSKDFAESLGRPEAAKFVYDWANATGGVPTSPSELQRLERAVKQGFNAVGFRYSNPARDEAHLRRMMLEPERLADESRAFHVDLTPGAPGAKQRAEMSRQSGELRPLALRLGRDLVRGTDEQANLTGFLNRAAGRGASGVQYSPTGGELAHLQGVYGATNIGPSGMPKGYEFTRAPNYQPAVAILDPTAVRDLRTAQFSPDATRKVLAAGAAAGTTSLLQAAPQRSEKSRNPEGRSMADEQDLSRPYIGYRRQRATPSSEETKEVMAKDLPELVADYFLPQDAADVGMMLLPGGKVARKAGAALIAGGTAGEAEAGGLTRSLLKMVDNVFSKPTAQAAARGVAEPAEKYGAKAPEFITAYRGAAPGNAQRSSMNRDLVFMSRNKEAAKQYGDVTEHRLRGDVKLLDLNPENPEARRILFRTADWETLRDLKIKKPDDLRDPEKFSELFTDGVSDTALGMFPGKHAPALLKAYGYQGASWGDDFWLAGKVADYAAKEAPKEQKMLMGVYRGYAGNPAEEAALFATPQRRVADYYAQKRAAQTGDQPHVEMLLVDPFAGKQYGHGTMGTAQEPPMVTRARKLQPEDVKSRTRLYATGGAVHNIFDLYHKYAEGGGVTLTPEEQRYKEWLLEQRPETSFAAVDAGLYDTYRDFYKARGGVSEDELNQIAKNAIAQENFRSQYGMGGGQPWNNPNWRDVTEMQRAAREKQRIEAAESDRRAGWVLGGSEPSTNPPPLPALNPRTAAVLGGTDPVTALRAANIYNLGAKYFKDNPMDPAALALAQQWRNSGVDSLRGVSGVSGVHSYAEGGAVGSDQAGVNRMVAMEQGGLAQYDPDEIDALASRMKEEMYG